MAGEDSSHWAGVGLAVGLALPARTQYYESTVHVHPSIKFNATSSRHFSFLKHSDVITLLSHLSLLNLDVF